MRDIATTHVFTMPGMRGIYETHLTVVSLNRALTFYRDLLGLEIAHLILNRNAAFLWVDDKRLGMLGLWETGSAPMFMRLHMAFRLELDEVIATNAALTAHGIQQLDLSGDPVDEPVVIGWMPAVSQYCRDPDGHSIEFIHVLDEPPDLKFGVKPYSQWLARSRALSGHRRRSPRSMPHCDDLD